MRGRRSGRDIARDLHDEALTGLSDAISQATLNRARWSGTDFAEQWSNHIHTLQRVARQLRGSIYDLRLDDDNRPFAELLGNMVSIQAALSIAGEVRLAGVAALPPSALGDRGVEVLRIVRESITNARRHSGATVILVDAGDSTADVLRVSVADNGSWPTLEADTLKPPAGGMLGMRQRAALLGANFQIAPNPAGGTVVSIEVDLSKVV